MHPVSFFEFLNALGEQAASDMYQQIPLPAYAHEKFLSLFHRYAVLGGMPEAVRLYAEAHDVASCFRTAETGSAARVQHDALLSDAAGDF